MNHERADVIATEIADILLGQAKPIRLGRNLEASAALTLASGVFVGLAKATRENLYTLGDLDDFCQGYH